MSEQGRPTADAAPVRPADGEWSVTPAGSTRGVGHRRIWVDLLLYPTHTLPTAAAPVLVAAALAWHDKRFAPVPVLIAFLASWLIHVGGVFVDNYELLVRHPHIREHPELNDAVRDGTLQLRVLRLAAIAWFVLAALTGPYLWGVGGWPVAVVGILGAAASFGYAGRPFAYVEHGLADVLFLVMFGIVAVLGIYYISSAATSTADPWTTVGHLPLSAFVIGLPAGLLVTNVMVIDDIRDERFDTDKGWHTTAVRFGLSASRLEFIAFTVASYLFLFWFWFGLGMSAWVLLPLLTLPQAFMITRKVVTAGGREELVPMTPRTAFLALAHSLLLALGVALS